LGSVENRAFAQDDLVNLLGDVISAHAPDATYRFASAASLDLMGYTPDELVGTSPYDYFHPEDLEQIGAAHGTALKAEPYTVSYRFRHKDGHYVWLETTGKVITDDHGAVEEILCCTRAIDVRPASDAGNVHDLRLQRTTHVIAEEALDIHLQPIIHLDTGEVGAYEALARFQGDGAAAPDKWFEDAWSVGRGIDLEMLAVEKALALLPLLPANAGVLGINVSPPTVAAPRFAKAIGGIEDRISLEITEHLEVADYSPLIAGLEQFRARGGELVVDDFGAGYASLSHIIHMRPDWVKLDIALIEQIETDPLVQAIVSGCVSFTASAGIGLVAEGIERDTQLEKLLDLGVKNGQGFLLGRPLPPEEALAEG
jgi:PAS domain S-box-containing protein